MIDLSKNTNPYCPSKDMLKFLRKNINEIENYSDKYVEIGETDILTKYNLRKENIIITNGTLGAMDLILRVHQNKTVGLFNPTFWGIKEIAKINNNSIVEKKINVDTEYDLNEIDKLASQSDILYLCNCNNPTLNYIESNKLIKIIKKNKNCLFIVDETILIFDEEFDSKTSIKYVNKVNNLVVLISLSKILGICGLRTGLLITSVSQKNKCIKVQVPYSNNKLSVLFSEKYFSKIFILERCKKRIKSNFEYLINNLDNKLIDNIIYNSSSFLLIQLKDNVDYEEIFSFVSKNNIKIAAINKYYNVLDKKYLRVSAGKKKDYKKLIKVFKKYEKKYLSK